MDTATGPLHREASVADRYAAIRDYALIGDCHGAALVSRDGSIDWATLSRFDADPIFCSLLDAERGGAFVIAPTERYQATRRYRDRTNILETRFRTADGIAEVVDFMPVGRPEGAGPHNYVDLRAPHWLVRRVRGVRGLVGMRVRYRPTPGFAQAPVTLARGGGWVVCDGAALCAEAALKLDGGEARTEFEIGPGETRHFVLAQRPSARPPDSERLGRLLEITRCFWEEWSGYCSYEGPYRDAVLRSALALKLMTYSPTGAIVAAPTTSLPEALGGKRNWDYRYCWLRDASLTLYSLAALGFGDEARRFGEFLCRRCDLCGERERPIQIMFGIGAERDLAERELPALEGYRGSRPVRVGNAAYSQRQLDIYGELLDWAALIDRLGGSIHGGMRLLLEHATDFVATHWREPSQGMWESRGPALHYVHDKFMCWVALDRACRLLGPREAWTREREELERDMRAHAVDARGGYLTQAYGDHRTDVATLRAYTVAAPFDPGVLAATVEQVLRELKEGDFIRRYRSEDGVAGSEGCFLIGSFWLVDALLCGGRGAEARSYIERLLASANDVGLYAEEIDPADGTFLGNFPQALTHLALIHAVINLDLYERGGADAVKGSFSDRVERAVEMHYDIRSWWRRCPDSHKVARYRSSPNSILPEYLLGRTR